MNPQPDASRARFRRPGASVSPISAARRLVSPISAARRLVSAMSAAGRLVSADESALPAANAVMDPRLHPAAAGPWCQEVPDCRYDQAAAGRLRGRQAGPGGAARRRAADTDAAL